MRILEDGKTSVVKVVEVVEEHEADEVAEAVEVEVSLVDCIVDGNTDR